MPFGGSTISHGGCGPVSVYNAAQILGRCDISFDDVLEYYENSGGILLGGLLGSLPHTAENYFKDQGYDVVTLKGDAVFYAGNMSKEFDASILWYWFKDDEFPYFGAHFIAFKQFEDAGYYYNFTDSVYRSTGSFYSFVDTQDILYAEMILIKKP